MNMSKERIPPTIKFRNIAFLSNDALASGLSLTCAFEIKGVNPCDIPIPKTRKRKKMLLHKIPAS